MTEQTNKSIKENVLEAIDSGKVNMKPKWHFIINAILLAVGVVFAILTLLYITSFIIFALHQNGLWFAPGFGGRGIRELLFDFPWLLVFVAIIFIGILQYLIKQYSFSYGKPLIYSAITIVLLVILGGLIISQTPIHKSLFLQARNSKLPFAGKMYLQYGLPLEEGNITVGEIIKALQNGFNINTPKDEIITVIITPQTRFPIGTNFVVGKKVMVIGDREGLIIHAFGIRPFNENEYFQPPFEKHPR
jgi:hypothetical protein